jgi:hypothetical protein
MTNSRLIDFHRNNFIESVLTQSPGRIEYICQVDKEDVPLDRRDFFTSKLVGDEILVEFHRFHLLEDDVEIAMLQQFRFRPSDEEMKEEIKIENWLPVAYIKSTDASGKRLQKKKRKINKKRK